jgi:hypothetical protein
MARISEGRAANRVAPEFSGGGNAEAGPDVSAGAGSGDVSAGAGSGDAGAGAGSGGGEARAGSAVPVTATPPLSGLLGESRARARTSGCRKVTTLGTGS